MNKTYVLALAALFFAAPMAYAHVDGTGLSGVPKLYCEDSPLAGDQDVHEYGPPSTGFLIALGSDWSTPQGQYPLLSDGCAYAADVPNQWDGHYEFALGGAWLLACNAACGDGTGAGAEICFGTYADHREFPTVWVEDAVFSIVAFSVFADTASVVPPLPDEPNCGDFESDFGIDCVGTCGVAFPPGLDGSYQVYVVGTKGHVCTVAACPPGPLGTGRVVPACSNELDDDGDNRFDYPDDPGCVSPADRFEAPDPECGDQLDNDNDGGTDFGNAASNDPDCDSVNDSETPECSDGFDNDEDLAIDAADPECANAADDDESA